MATISSLPYEIISHIFDFLTIKDVIVLKITAFVFYNAPYNLSNSQYTTYCFYKLRCGINSAKDFHNKMATKNMTKEINSKNMIDFSFLKVAVKLKFDQIGSSNQELINLLKEYCALQYNYHIYYEFHESYVNYTYNIIRTNRCLFKQQNNKLTRICEVNLDPDIYSFNDFIFVSQLRSFFYFNINDINKIYRPGFYIVDNILLFNNLLIHNDNKLNVMNLISYEKYSLKLNNRKYKLIFSNDRTCHVVYRKNNNVFTINLF